MPRRPTAKLPSVKLLREFIDYNPETGVLKWRVRDARHFPSLRICHTWNSHYAGKEVGWLNANGYYATRFGKPSFLVQRIIWKIMTGKEPPDLIDHIDGNRTNNLWNNLREATAIQSAHNQGVRSTNTSGFRGVLKRGNRYMARVMIDGKYRSIGTFQTAERASAVYEDKIKELYGKFYRNLNNPSQPSS
jgi:hypothetical protein